MGFHEVLHGGLIDVGFGDEEKIPFSAEKLGGCFFVGFMHPAVGDCFDEDAGWGGGFEVLEEGVGGDAWEEFEKVDCYVTVGIHSLLEVVDMACVR